MKEDRRALGINLTFPPLKRSSSSRAHSTPAPFHTSSFIIHNYKMGFYSPLLALAKICYLFVFCGLCKFTFCCDCLHMALFFMCRIQMGDTLEGGIFEVG